MKYLLVLANIIFLVLGQSFWKYAVKDGMTLNLQAVLRVLISPWFIIGAFLYVGATIIWLFLLSKYPLSFLYPLQSLAYVLGLIVALFFFKEDISLIRWIGVSIILLGVFVVSKS